MAEDSQGNDYQGMKPYIIPILFTWLSLLIALAYVNNGGWHSTEHERNGDWYWGYADTLATDGKYQNCAPQPDSIRCATPLPDRAYRLPGYPIFLAGVLLIVSDNPVPIAKALQAVMVAGVVYIMVSLIQRIDSRRWVIVSGGVVMLGARQVYYNAPLAQTETLFMFVLVIFAQAFLVSRWKLAGVLWGLSLLIRTSLIFATPFLLFLMPRKAIARFSVCVVLVLIPYTVRNFAVLGVFAPFGTNGGMNIKAGHNAESYATGQFTNPDDLADWSDFVGLNEVAQDRALRVSGVDYIKSHLAELPVATLRKLWASIELEGVLLVIVWCIVGILKWRATDGQPIGETDRRAIVGSSH